MLGYNEICENKWRTINSNSQGTPYAKNGDQWVGYDNVESVKKKCDYISESDLGGAMFWSLENDDFLGKGGEGKFPLVKAAKKSLYDKPRLIIGF